MESSSIAVGKKQSSLRKWFRSGKGQRITIMVTFMLIPLLLLVVFTYLPFAKMIEFSFFEMKYIGDRKFVGFDNYVEVFKRDDCFKALKLSLYYMVASFIQLGLALYFASVLSFKTKGGGVFKGMIFFPYLISGIAVGFIFKFFYTRGFVLDSILEFIGFDLENLPYWLRDTKINNISLAATSVWRYMGQNMVLFIGAIMSVDTEMYEAAALDGASGFQKFKYIILPSIKTIVILNLILSISGSLSAFEPPYVITGGNFGTATYFVVMNRLAHTNQKVGLAAAMAVILLVLIFIVTIVQKVVLGRVISGGSEDVCSKTARRLKKYEEKGEIAG